MPSPNRAGTCRCDRSWGLASTADCGVARSNAGIRLSLIAVPIRRGEVRLAGHLRERRVRPFDRYVLCPLSYIGPLRLAGDMCRRSRTDLEFTMLLAGLTPLGYYIWRSVMGLI